MARDGYERKHRRTWRHPESMAIMAGADFDAVPSLAEAMGLTEEPKMTTIRKPGVIKTRLGQTRLAKGDEAAAMVRLVRELREVAEEAGLLGDPDYDRINDVLYGFLKTQTRKVRDEVYQG